MLDQLDLLLDACRREHSPGGLEAYIKFIRGKREPVLTEKGLMELMEFAKGRFNEREIQKGVASYAQDGNPTALRWALAEREPSP
jgi:hypothetical protein